MLWWFFLSGLYIIEGTIMSKIGTKPVSELLNMKFFIPSYQRGYRWTGEQVQELLDDIYTFKPQGDQWYCLQPLVVKSKDDVWEVIDGQQRLTTIFLIIHYANEMWEGKDQIHEPEIRYETRQNDKINSFDFLKSIKIENDLVKIDESNIDYFYISKAYFAIHNWVKNKKKGGAFNRDQFKDKFQHQTRIIWYESDGKQDSRDVFTRINIGKIPLTNSELIKALFLNSSNFKTENSFNNERVRLKQLEIASEWDNMEYALHNDEFWLFINNEENYKETRIEFIFELITGKSDNKEDTYYTFREYFKKFTDNTEEVISDNWKEVKRYFQTLQYWYENRELYHKIGFLITLDYDIVKLIET